MSLNYITIVFFDRQTTRREHVGHVLLGVNAVRGVRRAVWS